MYPLDIYLKPFAAPLRTMYSSSELKAMNYLLVEKGLRVREELELGNWTSDVEMANSENEEDGGAVVKDVETLYEERRKLMPY